MIYRELQKRIEQFLALAAVGAVLFMVGCLPSQVQSKVAAKLKEVRANRGETRRVEFANALLDEDLAAVDGLTDAEPLETEDDAAEPNKQAAARSNPFCFPAGVELAKTATSDGNRLIKLFGFSGTPPMAILSINGVTHVVRESQLIDGIEIVEISAPVLTIRVDGQVQQLSLINRLN